MAESHNRVKQVFAEAMQQPAEQRAGFIERACEGDATLLNEVRMLVDAIDDAAAAGFLAQPTMAAPSSTNTLQSAVEAGPGTVIGPYKLLQLIGEGGFGSVFMAQQSQPVQRRVALKIIKLGMDTKQVIARFEAERQALAMMDHPNIARVLDAGATDAGRPYFVMELVKGDPITDYCDKNNLSIEHRLELFAQACNAVQHSHQKGVIHRDIKPTNILVSTQDGKPHAKILDFGIAKATAARLTEKTLFTEHRTLIGTPEYMSPEQAEGSMDIDTRTDVYSLGVLLYELLTGATPFDSEKLRSAAYGELQRIIREVDPPNPSTRLSQNADTIGSVAARRKTEPRKLGSIIRGELDWIVMKALDKDRARRYESANALAADIQRYLGGEAVVAAPPSAAYRFKKFVRRNRGLVAAGSVVAAALVIGCIGTTLGLVKAERSRRLAVEESQRANAATLAESSARQRAEAVAEFVTTALRSGDANNAGGGQDVTILQVMRGAVADIDSGRFQNDPQTEAQLRETISIILRNNGSLAEAESLAAQALVIHQRIHPGDHPNVARSLNMLAAAREKLGHRAEAERLTSQSLAMYQRLHPGDHADVAALLNNLGQMHEAAGKAAEAETLLVQAVAMHQRLDPSDAIATAMCMDNLAKALQSLGRLSEADSLFAQALDMRQRLHVGDHPDLAVGLNNLAGLRLQMGQAAQGEPLFVQALDMRRRLYAGDHPVIAESLLNLAQTRMALQRAAEAEPLVAEALDINRRLFAGDHPNVGHTLYTLASLQLDLGKFAEAETACIESAEMHRRLFEGDHMGIGMSLVILARTRAAMGRFAEASSDFDQALAMLRRLMPEGSPQLARVLRQSGSARMQNAQAEAALPQFEEALAMAEKFLPPEHPQLQRHRDELAQCRAALAGEGIMDAPASVTPATTPSATSAPQSPSTQ